LYLTEEQAQEFIKAPNPRVATHFRSLSPILVDSEKTLSALIKRLQKKPDKNSSPDGLRLMTEIGQRKACFEDAR
jgi:hypothetical protein